MAAKAVAGKVLQPIGGAQQHFALNRQISTGGTKQILGIHRHFRRIPQSNVARRQRKIKVDAFGQKVFDQKGLAVQGWCLKIGKHLQPPDAARGRAGDRQLEDMAARARIFNQGARVFHTIGALQNGGQGQAFDRSRLRISCQSGGVNRFTRAIGAAIGG